MNEIYAQIMKMLLSTKESARAIDSKMMKLSQTFDDMDDISRKRTLEFIEYWIDAKKFIKKFDAKITKMGNLVDEIEED